MARSGSLRLGIESFVGPLKGREMSGECAGLRRRREIVGRTGVWPLAWLIPLWLPYPKTWEVQRPIL